jgi:Zn-dependent M28 family amino/carboxypeptidase
VRDQFVIVSAHYDHLGMKPPGPGNRIFHGANDNASSDASLIEIAKALSAEPHPRRSLLFLALFGEEEGLLGSGYYVRHPLIPLSRTVADINLEQLGRTDTSDGPELARFSFTGPSYSNLPQMMAAAAKTQGDTVYRKETADDYFDRSDNYSFALAGVVAHTIVVAFEFPDYHAVSDEADKIDYANLAKVDRGITAGIAAVANAEEAPRWSNTRFNRR